jgi:dTDP-4-amino-4,6-dideoxygalactose transaminase/nucleoside-diphosphate-sugar epimerase
LRVNQILRQAAVPGDVGGTGGHARGELPALLITGGDALAGALATQWRSARVTATDQHADPAALARHLDACDVVVHVLHDDDGRTEADERFAADVLGTHTVLRACLAAGRPVVLGSSAAAYGRRAGVFDESAPAILGAPGEPGWQATVTCLAAEAAAAVLARHGLRYVVARYAWLYGPQLGGGGVISRFLGCIRDGAPLPLLDGGRGVRAFCYVDDAVAATAALAASLWRDDALAGRTFNVGSDQAVSMAELGARLVRLSGHRPGCVAVPSSDAAPRLADAGALRTALGLGAPTPLEEGLRRTLAHHGLLAADAAPAPPATERVPWVRPILDPDATLLTDLEVALSTGRVTNGGPLLHEFERRLAAYLGVEDCVAVSSGSAALLLANRVLGLERGAAVLPSFTFIATLNAVVQSGLTPVFCDIDPDTWTLDPAHLTRLLDADRSIRLVMPVTVFGVLPDLPAIERALRGSGAALVLDNAHGVGSERGGVRCPSEPVVQTFSLHATKVLPAVEGGAVVASDQHLLAEVRRLRNHGLAADLLQSTLGFNAKLSDLHAAVGLRSLRGLDEALARRRDYAERLRAVLHADCGEHLRAQRVPDGLRSNFQNLGVRCGDGELAAVQAVLDGQGVETRRYFWPPMHELPDHRGRWHLPVTDAVAAAMLCLPLHSRMEPATLARIEAALRHLARR